MRWHRPGTIMVLAVVAACSRAPSSSAPNASPAVVTVAGDHCYLGLQPVTFAKGSAHVSQDFAGPISGLASAMKDDPSAFVLVELSAHASDDEMQAMELSTQRALAVRDALVALGIDPARLRARGYGAHCPMEPRSDEGRMKNRRVEARVVRTNDGASGVELGCEAARAAGVTL